MYRIITILFIVLFAVSISAQRNRKIDGNLTVTGTIVQGATGTDTVLTLGDSMTQAERAEMLLLDLDYINRFNTSGWLKNSQKLGWEAVAIPIYFIPNLIVSLTTDIADGQGKGTILEAINDTMTHVRFDIYTAAVGATYDSFNGVVICDENYDTLGTTIATDGTFWNSASTVTLELNNPIILNDTSIYYAYCVYNVSAETSGPILTCSQIDTDRFDFFGSGVAFPFMIYNSSLSTIGASITPSYTTSTVPIITGLKQ